jgi:hypothetical protein
LVDAYGAGLSHPPAPSLAVRDAVAWLASHGYADQADQVVLGLEAAGFAPTIWLREVSTLPREDLVAFAGRFDTALESAGNLSLTDHQRAYNVSSGSSGAAAVEAEARRQRLAVSGGLHVAGADVRWSEWKKAEARAAKAKDAQRRVQAEQDAKFRAGMMLKLKREKAKRSLAKFKDLGEGCQCDARDR